MSEAVPRLSVRGLTKSFGGSKALDGADLTLVPGEIHGFLGKNGSGKSTLIKVLSGFHAPDAGTLEIDGRPVPLPLQPGRSEAHGLAFVHQNLGLLPDASVLENLIAGDRERLNPYFIDWRAEAARARAVFAEHNLALSPGDRVDTLAPVERAQLAIVRAADRIGQHRTRGSPGILVLDEPTPFLPQQDVRALFALMRRVAATGVAIVFVSHDIDEVREITDRSTVLRDGRVIGTYATDTTSRAALVEAIVGRAVAADRRITALPAREPAVRVQSLSGAIVRDVALTVAPGEILGLTGLVGAGHDEVPVLLAGARRARSGEMVLAGERHDLTRLRPGRAMAAGIVLIPADRPVQGIALDLSLTENATLPLLGRSLFLSHRRLTATTEGLLARFFVKAETPGQPAAELSGGNQQKLVLAKWLQLAPRLVLLDEPTQGIDVGARQEIYERLMEICAAGTAVICATSDFVELAAIAHRVLVFDRGRIKAEIHGDAVTKRSIAVACYDAVAHAA